MTASARRCGLRPSWSCAKHELLLTTRLPQYVDAESVILNWARWCKDEAGIYPHCPTNWEQFEQVEYKNCHETIDEKLDRLANQSPVDERGAERTELWVAQFDLLPQTALRTHYVYMPESQRHEWHATAETWQARRASWTQKRLRELEHPRKVDVDDYEAAVNEAMRLIGECLTMWARGV